MWNRTSIHYFVGIYYIPKQIFTNNSDHKKYYINIIYLVLFLKLIKGISYNKLILIILIEWLDVLFNFVWLATYTFQVNNCCERRKMY